MKKFKLDFDQFWLFSVPVDFDLSWLKVLASNHLLVRLRYEGFKAVGEGVLYQTSGLKALGLLARELVEFFGREFTSFKAVREQLIEQFGQHPGLICAFDLALWDLESQVKQRPLYYFLGKKKREKIKVAEQLFIPFNKIALIEQLKRIKANQTELVKLKAGRSLEQDLENIKLINHLSEGGLEVQVDLNQGLSFDQAVWFGSQLEKLGVTAWEEPIKVKDFGQLRELKKRVKLPIILDESVKSSAELSRAVKAKAGDILNLKLSRLGGISRALALAKQAQQQGLEIEVGCSEELGVATQAQLYLSAVIRKVRAQEALGSQRLGFEIVREGDQPEIVKGRLKTPAEQLGLGVSYSSRKLAWAGKRLGFEIVSREDLQAPFWFYAQFFKTRLQSKLANGWLLLRKQFNLISQPKTGKNSVRGGKRRR